MFSMSFRVPREKSFSDLYHCVLFLLCVVENNSQGISAAGVNGADAVAQMGPVKATGALHGSMVNREDYRVSLVGSEHLNARLPAWLLLGEDEFAAFKISSRLAQKEGD